MKTRTSICTWSLQNDLKRVTEVMQQTGLSGLHLDISDLDTFKPAIKAHGWTISSTMISFPQEDYSTLESIKATGGIIPDAEWPNNRALMFDAIEKTAAMQVPYLSTHVGFIDHTDHASYAVFCERIQELVDAAAAHGIMLLLETGQETAAALRTCLQDLNHPSLGVNFDPANMLLYGKGDPIEAIQILAPWIKHVHIKDAMTAPTPGTWGQEVPWGEGEVDTAKFFEAFNEIAYDGAFAIEREAGEQRVADIVLAAKRMEMTV
ncbi:MAG: sugar phosphate isomerase/epimerase family protein [Opitutaceae bacterium]